MISFNFHLPQIKKRDHYKNLSQDEKMLINRINEKINENVHDAQQLIAENNKMQMSKELLKQLFRKNQSTDEKIFRQAIMKSYNFSK